MRQCAAIQPLSSMDHMDLDLWERLKIELHNDLIQVDQKVEEHLASRVPLLSQVTQYIVGASGKRLRPMLTLACARLLGYTGSDHISLAASIELIHTATLLHDDVIDDSSLRRGRKTAHLIWGQKVSILAGDFLFSQAFHMMMCQNNLDVLRVLARATSSLAEGEVLQMETMTHFDCSPEHYFQVIGAKTAALFQAACHVASIISQASPEQHNALIHYGYNLGLIFQIRDDMLDYDTASHGARSSVPGDDIKEGKVTLPILLCYQRSSEEEKCFWRQVFDTKDISAQDWERVLTLLDHYRISEVITTYVQDHVQQCALALSLFPHNPVRALLEELTVVLGQCKA